jgi:hypothetical protein
MIDWRRAIKEGERYENRIINIKLTTRIIVMNDNRRMMKEASLF